MDRNCTKYKAEQLLDDEYFIKSELHPTCSDITFWTEQENKDDELAKEIEIARDFLKTLKHIDEKYIVPEEAEQRVWEQIGLENHMYDKKLRRRIKVALSIAASISLLIGLFWYFRDAPNLKIEIDYSSMLEAKKQSDSLQTNIQLIRADNEAVSIDGEEASLEYEEDGSVNINSTEKINAAKKTGAEKTFNQLIVPKGKRLTITFHDGTRLWVNSGSTIMISIHSHTVRQMSIK